MYFLIKSRGNLLGVLIKQMLCVEEIFLAMEASKKPLIFVMG